MNTNFFGLKMLSFILCDDPSEQTTLSLVQRTGNIRIKNHIWYDIPFLRINIKANQLIK